VADYKLSTVIETNAGQVARDMDRVADSTERVGTSAAKASGGTDALTLAQQKLEMANRRVVETGEKVDRMQRHGATSTATYTQAMERHLRAQQAVLTETAKIERLQSRAPVAGRPTGGSLGRNLAGGIAGAVTAGAVTRYLMDSKDAASDLNETVAKSRALFGPASQAVEEFGKTANTQIGASKQAAIEATTAFGTLFQGVGLGAQTSAGLSVNLTKLSADLAAYAHDPDASKATEALNGALRGQYDTLGKYGIVLTAADVKQKAFQLGLIRTAKDAITPAAQAQAVYALALEKSTAQAGTFARRSGEAAEKTQILAATSENAKGTIGQGLIPVMKDLTDLAQKDLMPALEATGKALGFLGEHESIRRIGELGVALLTLQAGVGYLAGAYDRLAGSAGRAAVAEDAAAAPRAGLPRRLGATASRVAGVYAVGSLLAAGVNGSERDKLRQGAEARGTRDGFRTVTTPYNELAGHYLGKGVDSLTGLFGIPGVGGAVDRASGYSYDHAAYRSEQERRAREAADDLARRDQYGPRYRGALSARDRAQQANARAQFGVRDARAYLDSRQYVKDAGSVPLGGLFDALPEKPDASQLTNARDEQKAAAAALAIAQARARKVRSGPGGASRASIAAAEAAVLTAQDAMRKRGGNQAAEALKLEAAEGRLAKLRQGGKTDTVALMTAEKGLEDARVRSRRANEKLHKAEKDASGDRSLTLQEVLARAARAASTSTGEAGNVRTLVKKGVSEPVIAELERLEQTAPGTIAKVARGLTPAFVNQLNRDQAARDQAAIDIAKLGGQAKLAAAQAQAALTGKTLGDALTAGVVAALRDPAWQAEASTPLAGLLTPGSGGKSDPAQPKGLPGLFALPPVDVSGLTYSRKDPVGRRRAVTPGVAAGLTTPATAHGAGPSKVRLHPDDVQGLARAVFQLSSRTTVNNTFTQRLDPDAIMRIVDNSVSMRNLS
jgi:hypothetical protein